MSFPLETRRRDAHSDRCWMSIQDNTEFGGVWRRTKEIRVVSVVQEQTEICSKLCRLSQGGSQFARALGLILPSFCKTVAHSSIPLRNKGWRHEHASNT